MQRAIASVLGQGFADFELVVVDDGSTDGIAAALSHIDDSRLRIVRHDARKGAAAGRNTGICDARGKYVAFLDSDDYWLPEKLRRQLEFMLRAGSPRVSCTAYRMLSPYCPDGEDRFAPDRLRQADLQHGCRISPGTTLMAERALFAEVGLINEKLDRLEDWDWLLRCLAVTDLAVLNDVLAVVDGSEARAIDFVAVQRAVKRMKKAHFRTDGLLPSRTRRRYLATLENELAATAYRNGWPVRAAWHFGRSLVIHPYRSADTIRRLVFAVYRDFMARRK